MRFTLALVAAILAACAAPTNDGTGTNPADTGSSVARSDTQPAASRDVELRTDAARYAPGAKVTLTLVNRTDATYAFNPCTRIVMREVGGRWRNIEEPGRMCTMEAWILDPKATRSGDTDLPPSLEAGRYRIGVSLTRDGQTAPTEPELAVSAPFTIGS